MAIFSCSNVNFISAINFTKSKFFFFRLFNGYLKFTLPRKKVEVLHKSLSSLKSINKNFYFNFLERYFKFFNKNIFSINKFRKSQFIIY